MVYTVTTLLCRLRLTPHRQWFFRNSTKFGVSHSARERHCESHSYKNNQLESYISTERPVCSKSRCHSFSRWQQQCSFSTSNKCSFLNHKWKLDVSCPASVCVSLLCWWVSTTQHTLGMNEWRLVSGRGGEDREQLVKKSGAERRDGDKFGRPVGYWFYDASSLHTIFFVLLILVCLTAL